MRVIAQSYPDIFYRNSLSNGLVLITLPDTSRFCFRWAMNYTLIVDTYTIENVTQGADVSLCIPNDCDTFRPGWHDWTGEESPGRAFAGKQVMPGKEDTMGQIMVEKIVSRQVGRKVSAVDQALTYYQAVFLATSH